LNDFAEPQLRAFLLGSLPESETEKLETALIERQDLVDQLNEVEDDLLDAYAAGQLSDAESDAVLRRYRSRIAFAHGLARQKTNVVAFRARWIAWPLAAAAALVVVWMSGRKPAEAPMTRPPQSIALPQVAATLTIGVERDEARPVTSVTLPRKGTLALTLQLNPKDIYDEYTVAINGEKVADHLKRNGAAVTAVIPVESLLPGRVEVTIDGQNAGKPAERIGFEPLDVR
jgi:hypothetical protein